jgi:hypothetical protein
MMDLVQNSIEADATEIELKVMQSQEMFEFSIKDNGKGMSKETQKKAIDPFYSDGLKHAHRRVGLGLPFLLQTADATDGRVIIESEEGRGTQIKFSAEAQHVDLPPQGDFTSAAVMMMSHTATGNLRIVRTVETESYSISRQELTDTVGDLNNPQNLKLMKTYFESQEETLEKAG